MTWTTSTRAARLPADWSKRREQTKQRANGLCEAKIHAPECNGIGAECDHINRGDDHSLSNLQWLSEPCHRVKTLGESAEARRARRTRRHIEAHPNSRRGSQPAGGGRTPTPARLADRNV